MPATSPPQPDRDAHLAAAEQPLRDAAPAMRDEVIHLANTNSGTRNLAGVERIAAHAARRLADLGAAVTREPLPAIEEIDDQGNPQTWQTVPAIVARVRPDAPRRVLLNIHLDTVFAEDHPFQQVTARSDGILNGPGVADAKGGLVVMLHALEAFERLPAETRDRIGWTVVLNPDEEIGSPASTRMLRREALAHQLGLVYEPAMVGGVYIGARKGSGNFTVVTTGVAAHAGRDFDQGRNAIHALTRAFDRLAHLTDPSAGVTVNVARITGGGPANVVPAHAVGRLNIRVTHPDDMDRIVTRARDTVEQAASELGCTGQLHGSFLSPPKPMTPALAAVHQRVERACQSLNIAYQQQPSGGVCDGNKIADAGCPCVDTMGPVGGKIHSADEWLDPDSLVPRAQVTLRVLHDFARDASPTPNPTR
ncbi:MAG: hydrolase [Planctomycetota bacterium]